MSELSLMAQLFWRFLVISLLAFGGGQAALPMVANTVVAQTGWVSAQVFSTSLAFTYLTPGPVLILASFIGFRVAGIGGAIAATVGVFLMPATLAAGSAHALRRFAQHPWLRGFGRGAGPAAVGLLVVTGIEIARHSFASWLPIAIALVALTLSARTRVHPLFILAGGAAVSVAGWLIAGF